MVCVWPSAPRRGPSGASRCAGRGSASRPVAPRPIRPAGRGFRPPAVARCRARHAARRCRGLRSRCPSRRLGPGRCGRRGCRRHRPGRGCAPRCVPRSPRCRRRAARTRRCGCRRGSDAQCLDLSAQRLGAADGLRRAVERGQVTVAGVLHHRAAESVREVGGDLTKAAQHRAPPLVARGRGVCRRGDHVGEQHSAQGAM